MARRKDHTPDELRDIILAAAEQIIFAKGFKGLTARALATAIGYAPGTIYNFYRDMSAVLTDINFKTVGRLHSFCIEQIADIPADFRRLKALAYAYVDFAHKNQLAWETLFSVSSKTSGRPPLPLYYKSRIDDLFSFIEQTLHECLPLPPKEVGKAARLLWACLHGIAALTLDGRIEIIGNESSHEMIDELLEKHLLPSKI